MLHYNEMSNYIIDKSPILNLAFQYVYYLMAHMTNSLTPYQWCENYTNMHNLTALLEHTNSKNLNVVIIVNTNYHQYSLY